VNIEIKLGEHNVNLEVLISTMYQKDFSLVKKMNLSTDAIIINQCDREEKKEIFFKGKKIRIHSNNERGLSKSRNRAINNSEADICIIADDDLVYDDLYKEIVINAYNKYPDADIIAFNVPSTNKNRPTSILREGAVDFLHSMKLASFQITFRRERVQRYKLDFNESFGAGAKYVCGEENIFLSKCLQKGLKIKYINEKIATVNHNESTWFEGFNKELFRTKGAMFYEMSPFLSHLLIFQFAIRKRRLYKKEMNFINAYNSMINGLREYKDGKITDHSKITF
jgi:glycosyltransferase involved in cell wall biosynthesis